MQVDQGLNLQVPLPGGRKLGFGEGLYNRMVASATHFMQVRLCVSMLHHTHVCWLAHVQGLPIIGLRQPRARQPPV